MGWYHLSFRLFGLGDEVGRDHPGMVFSSQN